MNSTDTCDALTRCGTGCYYIRGGMVAGAPPTHAHFPGLYPFLQLAEGKSSSNLFLWHHEYWSPSIPLPPCPAPESITFSLSDPSLVLAHSPLTNQSWWLSIMMMISIIYDFLSFPCLCPLQGGELHDGRGSTYPDVLRAWCSESSLDERCWRTFLLKVDLLEYCHGSFCPLTSYWFRT